VLVGSRVIRYSGLSVRPFQLNSGGRVLPNSTAPAASRRETKTLVVVAGAGPVNTDPRRVGQPATAANSFTVMGMPSIGLSGSPRDHRSVEACAAASARGSSRRAKALVCSWTDFAWAMADRATSTGDSAPLT